MAEPPFTGNRRRPGHKSCAACKAIKMRCVRENDDMSCRRCIAKGQECITPEASQRKPRRGNRLELAKTLYGPLHQASSSSLADESIGSSSPSPHVPSSEEDRSSNRPSVQAESPTVDAHLSETSAESSLVREETYSWMSSHLIEEYFVASQYPLPVSRWKDFRADFEKAGRRPRQLNSPMSEVMAAVLMASGALVSNAPSIIGNDALASVGMTPVGHEMIHYGRSRAAVCEVLSEDAIRLADRKGAFRKESAESISVLVLFSILLDHGDPQRRRGRPYRVAAVAHARSIAEDRYPQSDYIAVTGALSWMLYLVDAWSSASANCLPELTDSDVHIICPMLEGELGLPNVDNMSSALNGADVWKPVRRLWAYSARLMRRLIPFLRKDLHVIAIPGPDGPLAILGQAYKELDEFKKCHTILHSILGQFLTTRRPGYGLLRYYSVMAPLGALLVTFYIDRAIKNWLDTALATDSLLEFEWLGLSELHAESSRRMPECARELARIFRDLLGLLPSRGAIALVPGVPATYETLNVWAETLSSIPTREDGYLTTYTLQEKRHELTWFLDALYSLGWAYDDDILKQATACIERTLENLVQREHPVRRIESRESGGSPASRPNVMRTEVQF